MKAALSTEMKELSCPSRRKKAEDSMLSVDGVLNPLVRAAKTDDTLLPVYCIVNSLAKRIFNDNHECL